MKWENDKSEQDFLWIPPIEAELTSEENQQQAELRRSPANSCCDSRTSQGTGQKIRMRGGQASSFAEAVCETENEA